MALVSVNRGATDSGTPGCGRDVEGIHFVRGRAAMVGRDSGPGVDRVGDQKRAWRTRCVRLSAQYFIAKVTQLDQIRCVAGQQGCGRSVSYSGGCGQGEGECG